jgi:hypothetical protein
VRLLAGQGAGTGALSMTDDDRPRHGNRCYWDFRQCGWVCRPPCDVATPLARSLLRVDHDPLRVGQDPAPERISARPERP